MPKKHQSVFANFTVYFHFSYNVRWSRPELLIEDKNICWLVFFQLWRATHLIDSKTTMMDRLIDSIEYIEITKKKFYNANHLSPNTNKNISSSFLLSNLVNSKTELEIICTVLLNQSNILFSKGTSYEWGRGCISSVPFIDVVL